MGYVRDKRYKLVFEDPEFAGLEITTKPMPTGDYLEMLALMEERPETTRESKVQHERITEIFATALLSWNLETEDGDPIPADLDQLRSLDLDLTLAVIRAYLDAISDVPAPLDEPSPSGGPSLEASIPMAPLSESPVS